MSQPAEPVVTVYLTNAVRTSQGPGPGVKHLPASEAGALVGMKYAVTETTTPRPRTRSPRRGGSAHRAAAATGALELGCSHEPTPKVITGPVPPDYADMPEDKRLTVAARLAEHIQGATR